MVFKKIAVFWGIFLPRTGIDVCHEICSASQIASQTAELLKSVSFQWPMPLSCLPSCQAKGEVRGGCSTPSTWGVQGRALSLLPAIAVKNCTLPSNPLSSTSLVLWMVREREGRMSGGMFPFVYQWDVLFSASNTCVSLLFFPVHPLLGFQLYVHRKYWIVLKEIHL